MSFFNYSKENEDDLCTAREFYKSHWPTVVNTIEDTYAFAEAYAEFKRAKGATERELAKACKEIYSLHHSEKFGYIPDPIAELEARQQPSVEELARALAIVRCSLKADTATEVLNCIYSIHTGIDVFWMDEAKKVLAALAALASQPKA